MSDLASHVTDGLMRLNRTGTVPGPGLVAAALDLLTRVPRAPVCSRCRTEQSQFWLCFDCENDLTEVAQKLVEVAKGARGYLKALPGAARPDPEWFAPLTKAIDDYEAR